MKATFAPQKASKAKKFKEILHPGSFERIIFIKSANSKKNLPFGSLLSIDDTAIPATESVEDLFIFNETEEVLNSFLTKELSALELSVIRLFLQDMSYKDISEKLDIPVKSVDNAIQRIRGKLKEFLTDNRS